MCFYVQYERNAFGTWVAGDVGVNADIYGLTPRSSVRKRRLRRRLRAIAALVVLAVIWLSFSVVRQFAEGRQTIARMSACGRTETVGNSLHPPAEGGAAQDSRARD